MCSTHRDKGLEERIVHLLQGYSSHHNNFSSSELLFNRKIRTKLPQEVNISDKSKDKQVRQTDELAKSKMKFNADRHRQAKKHSRIGDIHDCFTSAEKTSKLMTGLIQIL